MSDGTVNSQIVDSVSSVVALNGGTAPAQAFAMLDTVMIETLGMAMYNAVSRQQGASMIGSAAVTAACAKMLGTPFGICAPTPPAPPPPEPAPTGVQPLPPAPKSPAEIIAEATAEAGDALARIRTEEAIAEANVAAVHAARVQLATQANPSTPTPDPAPVPAPAPAPLAPPVEALYVAPDGEPVAPIDPAMATTTVLTFTTQTTPVKPCDPCPDAQAPVAPR